MEKVILIFIFSILNIFSIHAQEEVMDYEINSFAIRINHLTPEAIEAINNTKGKEEILVILEENANQSDFDLTCREFPWISELEIAYGNEHIHHITEISNLKSLTIFKAKSLEASLETPLDLKPLKELTGLIELNFYATHVSNTQALTNLSLLEDVSFYMSKVSDISFLEKTPNIKELSLYGFEHTFENYEPIASLRELRDLDIYMNEQATDGALDVLKPLNNLREINMANDDEITSLNFLENNTELEEIHANWCHKLSDFSALSKMKKLKELYLSDTALEDLNMLKGITTLIYIDISETQVKDLCFLEKCADLESIKISETPVKNISPLFKLKKLSSVELSPSIPEKQIKKLKSLNPNVEIEIKE